LCRSNFSSMETFPADAIIPDFTVRQARAL
jgi:hypothetical protein